MNNYLKNAFLLLVLFFCMKTKAQTDVINTNNGEKILCEIVREDSSMVYFQLDGEMKFVEGALERSKIKSIEYAKDKEDEDLSEVASEPIPVKNYKQEITASYKSKSFLALHIGLTQPVGVFAGTDLNNPESGFATNGLAFGGSLTHLAANTIGFIVKLMSLNNKFDSDPLVSYAMLKTGLPWKVDKTNWKSLSFNVGGVLFQDIGKGRILGRATIGYMSLKTPDIYMYIDKNNWIKQESAKANTFCLGFGTTISYKIVEDVGLSFDLDYYKADFLFTQIDTYSSAKQSSNLKNVKQPYNNILFTAGLCYNF